jgi:hypothetical protein
MTEAVNKFRAMFAATMRRRNKLVDKRNALIMRSVGEDSGTKSEKRTIKSISATTDTLGKEIKKLDQSLKSQTKSFAKIADKVPKVSKTELITRAEAKAAAKAKQEALEKAKARNKRGRGSAGGGGGNLASRGRSRSMLQLMKDARGPLNE